MNTKAQFTMADVGRKRPTARRAVAVGEFHPGPAAFAALVERRLPKGDALLMAEVAGLQGAKMASMLMPLCHPLLLEKVAIRCIPDAELHVVRVYCEVATEAKTGVEMEALAGVNAALLTLYDLTKPVEPALTLNAVRLLFKEGGKKGLWLHPDGMTESERAFYQPKTLPRLTACQAAVITLSDRCSRGEVPDASGPLLAERLRELGADVRHVDVLPDDAKALVTRIQQHIAEDLSLIMTTGGTGLGPRDCTPEALAALSGKAVPGLAEMFRSESRHHTAMAWLSRAEAVLVGNTLIIALPGSPKAVEQGMSILSPLLAHALAMMAGEGHA